MKVLITNDFKALRHGEFVTAVEESGEFIFDTETSDFSIATLIEIAKANKINIKKERKENMVSALETSLKNLNLPEMSQMSDTQKVEEIVLKGFEEGQTDDNMIVDIINSGIGFRPAAKMFKTFVEKNGLRLSSKKRSESVQKILEENEFSAETYEDVISMSERIAKGNSEQGLEAVADTTTQQAIKYIKKYCKELEIEFPKAPSKPKGGLRSRFLEFAASDPLLSNEQLAAWYSENSQGKDEKDVVKWMNRYLTTINHGRSIARKAIEIGDVAPVSLD